LSTIKTCLDVSEKTLSHCLPRPGGKCVLVEGFWLKCGNEPLHDIGGYVLTNSVRKNLKNLARVVSARYSVDISY
jgi:midasin (ATPase involved in ribosome maturation)